MHEISESYLYLVEREDGEYLIAKPVYDLNNSLEGWIDQKHVGHVYFEDDIVIGPIKKLMEGGKKCQQMITLK